MSPMSPHEPREEPMPWRVVILACEAGWLDVEITAGVQQVVVSFSAVFDPLPRFLAWLEAVACGVQACAFDVDEERVMTTFSAEAPHLGKSFGPASLLDFRLREGGLRQAGRLCLEVTLARRSLVGAFYGALREFAESERYDPDEWEDPSLDGPDAGDTGHEGTPLKAWRSAFIERWLADAAVL